uniref:Beta-defensin-like domain-containing protein n=1 Tax=Chrysemys picta bellii TaxID=8478 RepID=A0A8C3F4I1_CHRPI
MGNARHAAITALVYTYMRMKMKTLFLCAGFTRGINNPGACRLAGGFCRSRCPPNFRINESCGFVQSCCITRGWVSSGCHKGDITV